MHHGDKASNTHPVKFNFKDGGAETKVKIKPKPPGKQTPNTGESGHAGSWSGFLFLSLIALSAAAVLRIRYYS